MLLRNYSSGFLAAAINSSVTTITVSPGHNLPTTVAVFTAVIWNSTGYASPSQDPNAEIVWVQYFSPNTYTITRGMESTVGVAHSAGAMIGLYITAGVLSLPYVKVSETEAQNTGGGNSVSGSWGTRVLNTKDIDTANIASLAGNQLTLPPGTYQCFIRSPFYACGTCQIRLYNVTASAVLLIGSSQLTTNAAECQQDSIIQGQFTLAVSSAISIQYQTSGSQSGGLGTACNFTTEVYTVAEFTMVNT